MIVGWRFLVTTRWSRLGSLAPFLRGELQVLGRDEAAVQASFQVHPLWSFGALWLWNLGDDSSLLSPSFAYSASDEATLNGGMFLGLGPDASEPGQPLASEYGLVPTTVYFSVSLYF